ncbi:transcriptional regulator with XRE-family HTH domain [Pseudochelatococcus lubricantis]|uniref:Transcriptional regulator with XRE-family HTH domain n=2 Tax=Pseudochelatococcus lubricantis TaxID=1538102 RepID=A0ABX0UTD8_9HYPH|nr:transcriptional regulator with XRE-family HTH domain [Pseudochelatococcus lubricantis]
MLTSIRPGYAELGEACAAIYINVVSIEKLATHVPSHWRPCRRLSWREGPRATCSRFRISLRYHRKARYLTQDALADTVGLSSEMISEIEHGIAAPSFATVERLSEVLQVPEVAFFGVGMVVTSDNARTRQLEKIQTQLSRMNEDQLVRASKMLSALID